MKDFPYYKNQVLPDILDELNIYDFDDINVLLDFLKKAKDANKTIIGYCTSVDSITGLVELIFDEEFSDKIVGYIEKDDVTYITNKDGTVHIGRAIDCLDKFIKVKVKDITYDEENDTYKVKCSRKDVVKPIHDMYMNDIKSGVLAPNMKVKGIVTGMDSTRVFVDIGGDVTGILGVADIARAYVVDPSDVLSLGDELELVVKIAQVEPFKLSLSRKMLLSGWDEIDKKYKVGKIVPGIVKNRIPTGIFVELDECFEGLADFPPFEKNLKFGDRVKVRINVIDKKREKIKLKIISNR